ncbi:MAG TPA: sulfatase-like hydrolase/transferase [Phycisphaerae bacterium]|nr:sulfatase-like hydrolase/transferase [Phycisphaerae bacterium]HRY66486.1 sulfatase-like hydrolase/transferase [Phycisphaerae bacterium]HSA25806.1 sulfatase-like hydrolase/transferase [Phycisphaerae bacterium]
MHAHGGHPILLALGLLLSLDQNTLAASAAQTARHPNILFILIDDMGFGDLACYGGNHSRTPMIDGLAREGIRFTQFYVNAPICSPSRVAFTTGQYPGRWKITSYLDTRAMNNRRGLADWLTPTAPSLARYCAQAGYYTAHVGKWHMGGQRDVGDAPSISRYGFIASLTNFEGLGERVLPRFEPGRDGRPFVHVPTRMSAELGGGPIHWIDRHAVTAYYVDRALKEIRIAAGQNRPFYINLWLDDMHTPIQAPPAMRGDNSPAARYAGVLEEMDRQLGRLFDAIRADAALRENTFILLSSDNGPEDGWGSTGGLRGGKARLYEGGIRSPLIVWHRSIPAAVAGSANEKTVLAAMDLPPSLLTWADVHTPTGVRFDGLNMADTLLGRTAPERDQPLMWVRPPDRPGPNNRWPDLAIRDGDWKLLVFRDRSRPELYNLANDRKESVNLAGQHPDLTRRLSDDVIRWDQTLTAPPTSVPE